jgi:enoyl-CoA hydratase/carnithine racemase
MSEFDTLLFHKEGAVARISLNRPGVLNAYNIQMRDDFSETLAAVQDDSEVQALLITGEGRAFCAGADLTEFGTAPSQVVARRVRWERDVWGQFICLTKPVVVAVHGYCIGSGVEVALLGDLRLAAEGTIFALPEVQLGMIPAAGGTQTLPRSARPGAALEMLLTGRRFDAAEALGLGLVTRVLRSEVLLDEAWRTARHLASLDAGVTAAAKTALGMGADLPLEEALRLETRLAARMLGQ